MQFLKKFFRLRRKGAKRRKAGYYYVHWSYSGNPNKGDVWRIGYYNNLFDNWSLTGDTRLFKDDDFISIDNRRISGFGQFRFYYYLLIIFWPVWITWAIIYTIQFLKTIFK